MATRLVALLRGINVGRAKRVAMADLRGLLTGLGYSDVATVLQSGNVLFTTAADLPTSGPAADAATAAVGAQLESAVAGQLGVECRVLVRHAGDLAAATVDAPLADVATDPSRYLVGFLAGAPGRAAVTAVEALDVAPDQIRLRRRELYLWCPGGVLASPLSSVDWEALLGVAVTMRNWNTLARLVALAG